MRRCLAVSVECNLKGEGVVNVLHDLFSVEGYPDYIRSDNGNEFRAKELGVKMAYIALRSPWENGHNESFNGRLRDEVLNCESFCPLKEAQVLGLASALQRRSSARRIWQCHRAATQWLWTYNNGRSNIRRSGASNYMKLQEAMHLKPSTQNPNKLGAIANEAICMHQMVVRNCILLNQKFWV